jgi:hypothetical protein
MIEGQTIDNVEQVVKDIDKLINEMLHIRRKVASLKPEKKIKNRSVMDSEWFGMWADREDLKDLTTREWLQNLRKKQWAL